MTDASSQRGVGLVEVLVAVLLLSIAVLGFSALQVRAVTATDESLVRTKSLTLVRNLAEVMRAYPDAYIGSVPTVQAIVTDPVFSTTDSATSVTVDGDDISISGDKTCLSTEVEENTEGKNVPKQACSMNQLGARDTLLVKKMALDEGIKLAVVSCPSDANQQAIQKQMCVIAAWNDTKALMTDGDTGDNANACAKADGVYKPGSQCLISEAY